MSFGTSLIVTGLAILILVALFIYIDLNWFKNIGAKKRNIFDKRRTKTSTDDSSVAKDHIEPNNIIEDASTSLIQESITIESNYENLSQIDLDIGFVSGLAIQVSEVHALGNELNDLFVDFKLLVRPFSRDAKSNEDIWRDAFSISGDFLCGDIKLSIQLAYLGWKFSREDFDHLFASIQPFAQKHRCEIKYHQSLDAALNQASELELFINKYQKSYRIHVTPLSGGHHWSKEIVDQKITKLCKMTLGDEEIFEYKQQTMGRDSLIFALKKMPPVKDEVDSLVDLASSVSEVVFYMRIRLLQDPVSAYRTMYQHAFIFAAELSGQLLNIESEPIYSDEVERICQDISSKADEMRRHQIAPGGDIALRLF